MQKKGFCSWFQVILYAKESRLIESKVDILQIRESDLSFSYITGPKACA